MKGNDSISGRFEPYWSKITENALLSNAELQEGRISHDKEWVVSILQGKNEVRSDEGDTAGSSRFESQRQGKKKPGYAPRTHPVPYEFNRQTIQ